jgi:hypothetical protein
MTCDEALRSIGLFASEVMPALRHAPAARSAARNPQSMPTGW